MHFACTLDLRYMLELCTFFQRPLRRSVDHVCRGNARAHHGLRVIAIKLDRVDR